MTAIEAPAAPPAAHDAASAWDGFMAVLLGAAGALYLAGLGFILAVDPYDTGRTGLLGRRGVPEQLPHSANASRARDPGFDAAIFGNSHVQALKPERLDGLTGLHVVTLMMPGSYPADQLDTLRWYLIVRPQPRAVVIGADEFWCFDTTERSTVFPVWLYAPSFGRYLAGLASYRSLRESLKRLAFLRKGRGGARPDGYWDYSEIYSRFGARDENLRVLLEKPKPYRVNAAGRFPSLDGLTTLVSRVPPQTALVLLRPPAYRTAIPEPGTAEGRTAAACLDRLERIAASRPRTRLVDLFRRSPANDDPANFYDWLHYRDRYAAEIERKIAEALREIGLPPSPN